LPQAPKTASAASLGLPLARIHERLVQNVELSLEARQRVACSSKLTSLESLLGRERDVGRTGEIEGNTLALGVSLKLGEVAGHARQALAQLVRAIFARQGRAVETSD
jgi:hypothetical protein